MQTDAFDQKILKALRLNGRLPNNALAEQVGLSPSACLRRVKLLEQAGIIQGYTAIVSGALPGESRFAMVQVQLRQQSEDYLVRFERALQEHPEIQEWYLTTGDSDYVLRVEVAGIDEYGQFHREVLSRLPGVTRITSSFVMRSHRRT